MTSDGYCGKFSYLVCVYFPPLLYCSERLIGSLVFGSWVSASLVISHSWILCLVDLVFSILVHIYFGIFLCFWEVFYDVGGCQFRPYAEVSPLNFIN